MTAALGAAAGRVRAWLAVRRPLRDRPAAPVARWSLVAAGLACGAAAEDEVRGWMLAAALAAAGAMAAALRHDPVPRWARPQLALLVAAALLAGGLRERALRPPPVQPGAVHGIRAELHEPLRPDGGGRGAIASVQLGGDREVTLLIVPSRYALGGALPEAPAGARIQVDGQLRPLDTGSARTAAADPTSRAVTAWLRRQGVSGRLHASAVHWSGARRGGLLGAIDRAGERGAAELQRALGPRRGALVVGMALGRADGISDADSETLRTSGLWHLVAASGGNIALVIALVLGAGWLTGVPDRARLLLAALAVAAYVPLAGSGPSIQRAGVMGLMALLAMWHGHEHRARTALAMAAAATLTLQPAAWQDVGWQLSFAAAGGLIVAGPAAVRALIAVGVPRWAAVALATTAVATTATAPVMLHTFGELSAVGLLTNLAVAPLVGVIVWSGVLALVAGLVLPALAAVLAAPAGWSAAVVLAVSEWGAGRSHAVADVRELAITAVAILALLVLGMPRRWLASAVAVAAAVILVLPPRAPSDPRLVVLDIGQGSAALLQQGRDGILFDTGPRGAGIVRQLRATGVRRLRAVLLSHPAADHDGGTAEVLEAFPTDLLLDGGLPEGGPTHDAGVAVARRKRVRTLPLRAGQWLQLGAIELQVLWPTPAAIPRAEDPNDRSAVLLATVGGMRALLPGDAESNVLTGLRLPQADVLVLSHHGSRDAQLPAVLRRLRPAVGVISVGAHNGYGHPAPETLGQLSAARVPVLRTDQAGSVVVTGAGGRLHISRGPPTARR